MTKIKRERKHLIVFENGLVIHTDYPELFSEGKMGTKIQDKDCVIDRSIIRNFEGQEFTKQEILEMYDKD